MRAVRRCPKYLFFSVAALFMFLLPAAPKSLFATDGTFTAYPCQNERIQWIFLWRKDMVNEPSFVAGKGSFMETSATKEGMMNRRDEKRNISDSHQSRDTIQEGFGEDSTRIRRRFDESTNITYMTRSVTHLPCMGKTSTCRCLLRCAYSSKAFRRRTSGK